MADKINVQKTFSGVNEALTKLFDESGVKRTFTVPYIDGQGMEDAEEEGESAEDAMDKFMGKKKDSAEEDEE